MGYPRSEPISLRSIIMPKFRHMLMYEEAARLLDVKTSSFKMMVSTYQIPSMRIRVSGAKNDLLLFCPKILNQFRKLHPQREPVLSEEEKRRRQAAASLDWRRRNPERYRLNQLRWFARNRARVRAQERVRRRNDPDYKRRHREAEKRRRRTNKLLNYAKEMNL